MIRTLFALIAMLFALLAPTAALAFVEPDPGAGDDEVIVTMSAADYNAFQAQMRAAIGISSGNVATVYYGGEAEPTVQVEVIRNGGSSWWEIRLREASGWIRTWGFTHGGQTGLVIMVKFSTGRLG